MANWKTNPIMEWNGIKVTDHGRQPVGETTERIGTDTRMANGTLRRQHVSTKRSWSVSWENLPSVNSTAGGMMTADGNLSGSGIESFHKSNNGKFRLTLRRGSASGLASPNPAESQLPYEDANFYIVNVMFTEFSKEVHKRGMVDLWNVSVTMEEV